MNPSSWNTLEKLCLAGALLSAVLVLVGLVTGNAPLWHYSAIASATALAIGLGAIGSFSSFRFTVWIVAAVLTALWLPQFFQPYTPGSPGYKLLLLLLIQAVMFGMGTQMSLRDFAGVARSPQPVAIGLVCQFTIMPLVGYGLAIAFSLPAEIAAGMVLIGSCSSGLSSNVMAYIGRANLALSITLTAVATLLAPLVTPIWMKLLAGSLLAGSTFELPSFFDMMAVIIKIVIVPTGAALVHDFLKHATPLGSRIVVGLALAGMVLPVAMAAGGWEQLATLGNPTVLKSVELFLWILGAFAFGVLYHRATLVAPALNSWMPVVAMAGIIYVTGMTTAEGRETLFVVGFSLIVAAVLHNVLGYVLGYGMSRVLGLDPLSARTVAFEVGMQNGGMATGLAADMNKLGTLGLPAAIFIAWMNVSGSVLANYWRRRPIDSTDNTPSE